MVNSLDITGDLDLSLHDFQFFNLDYLASGYMYRSDFVRDGKVDLWDFIELVRAYADHLGGSP